jgi:hydrogenase 3 maturation protease
MGFEESLAKALEGASKVVVVGIGNELNGDDGFGVHVARELGTSGRIISIQAHTVPENFISKIAAEEPSHVIFIDAAVLDAEPGTLRLLEPTELAKVATVTHRVPLSRIIGRLIELHKCKVLVIGLQPKNMEIGSGLSNEVQSEVIYLTNLLKINLV